MGVATFKSSDENEEKKLVFFSYSLTLKQAVLQQLIEQKEKELAELLKKDVSEDEIKAKQSWLAKAKKAAPLETIQNYISLRQSVLIAFSNFKNFVPSPAYAHIPAEVKKARNNLETDFKQQLSQFKEKAKKEIPILETAIDAIMRSQMDTLNTSFDKKTNLKLAWQKAQLARDLTDIDLNNDTDSNYTLSQRAALLSSRLAALLERSTEKSQQKNLLAQQKSLEAHLAEYKDNKLTETVLEDKCHECALLVLSYLKEDMDWNKFQKQRAEFDKFIHSIQQNAFALAYAKKAAKTSPYKVHWEMEVKTLQKELATLSKTHPKMYEEITKKYHSKINNEVERIMTFIGNANFLNQNKLLTLNRHFEKITSKAIILTATSTNRETPAHLTNLSVSHKNILKINGELLKAHSALQKAQNESNSKEIKNVNETIASLLSELKNVFFEYKTHAEKLEMLFKKNPPSVAMVYLTEKEKKEGSSDKSAEHRLAVLVLIEKLEQELFAFSNIETQAQFLQQKLVLFDFNAPLSKETIEDLKRNQFFSAHDIHDLTESSDKKELPIPHLIKKKLDSLKTYKHSILNEKKILRNQFLNALGFKNKKTRNAESHIKQLELELQALTTLGLRVLTNTAVKSLHEGKPLPILHTPLSVKKTISTTGKVLKTVPSKKTLKDEIKQNKEAYVQRNFDVRAVKPLLERLKNTYQSSAAKKTNPMVISMYQKDLEQLQKIMSNREFERLYPLIYQEASDLEKIIQANIDSAKESQSIEMTELPKFKKPGMR